MLDVASSTALNMNILLSFFVVFLSGILILKDIMKFEYLFFVSFIKSLIPLLYITLFFEPTWSLFTTSDVAKFFTGAFSLEGQIIYTIKNDGIVGLLTIPTTWHSVTSLFFLSSLYIFGMFYWAPLFMSIIFSFLTMRVFYHLLISNNFKRKYSTLLVIFYGLHPYVIGWTSFVPLRESLMAFLWLSILHISMGFINGNFRVTIKNLLLLYIILSLIFSVRYYMIFIVGSSVIAFLIFYRKDINKMRLPIAPPIKRVITFVLTLCTFFLISYLLSYPTEHIKSYMYTPLIAIKWFLSPNPLSLSPEYTFLFLPSSLHVFLFLPSLLGGYFLWKHVLMFKFLIFNLIIASLVFGAVGLGIRQRFQFEFILIFMQFQIIFMLRKNDIKKLMLKT